MKTLNTHPKWVSRSLHYQAPAARSAWTEASFPLENAAVVQLSGTSQLQCRCTLTAMYILGIYFLFLLIFVTFEYMWSTDWEKHWNTFKVNSKNIIIVRLYSVRLSWKTFHNLQPSYLCNTAPGTGHVPGYLSPSRVSLRETCRILQSLNSKERCLLPRERQLDSASAEGWDEYCARCYQKRLSIITVTIKHSLYLSCNDIKLFTLIIHGDRKKNQALLQLMTLEEPWYYLAL